MSGLVLKFVIHPHPTRRRRTTNSWLSYWLIGVFITIGIHFQAVTAEIKFIPVNRSVQAKGDHIILDGREVDRPHEPLGLESVIIPTVDLTPKELINPNYTHQVKSSDTPSINDAPVLEFHDTSNLQDDDEDDRDDDDSDEEDGGEKESSQTSREYLDDDPETNPTDDSDQQSLLPTKRHRRRLMLLRGIGHPRGDDPEIAVRQTTSTVSSISSSTSSTHRPPKDFVIYALPEQSFWGVKKTKRRHGGDKAANNKIPSTPRLDDTPTAQAIPVSLVQPEPQQLFNDTATSSPPNRVVTDYYYETPPQQSTYQEENIVPPTTQPPPPETTTTFATTTTPTTTTTTSSTTPTPSPAETLKMTLAEKKFHLGQCMRYCMDAIL